ncbi:MAG: polyphosphate kinase 2, partial [Prochlorococcus sp.]
MGKDKNKKKEKGTASNENTSESGTKKLNNRDKYNNQLITFSEDNPAKTDRLNKVLYKSELVKLQSDLVRMQYWIKATGFRIIVLFEGRDAAGKGGAIKRLIAPLNPRGCRVVALGTPSDQQKNQWYFQRYIAHFPSAGEIVVFDRSWYNRAGVER